MFYLTNQLTTFITVILGY